MTTKLLPKADKVDIALGESESVTVPDGEVWKVSILFADANETIRISIDDQTFYQNSSSGEGVGINADQTMHEGRTLQFDFTSADTEVVWVGGWAFEYSE